MPVARAELQAVLNQPVQIHFGDDVAITAIIRRVEPTRFHLSDEEGPGWAPSGPYDIADVWFVRPWPPELLEERYLYNVSLVLGPVERTVWQPNRFAVMFARAGQAVTLEAEPGSLTRSGGPELVFEPAYADDEPSAPEFEQRSLASTEPVEAARQIRRLLGMPVAP